MINQRPTATIRRLFLHRSVPYVLFGLACVLSVVASRFLASIAADTAEAQAQTEFIADAEQTHRQIQTGLDTYLEAVRAGAVLLSADNEISGSEFRRFVDGLQLPERYPGMEGMGFAQCVRREDLPRFVRGFSLEGNAMTVWPETERAQTCPTLFLEPVRAAARTALGFDLTSEPALAEAMVVARDTGQAAVSRQLMDVTSWEGSWRGNVVVLLPVYRFGAPVTTIEARRAALVGFVFSPINSARLLDALVVSPRPLVAFEVYDSPLPSIDSLLGKWSAPATTGKYEASETVKVGGREWFLHMKSTAPSVGSVSQAALQTLIAGLILAFMLFLVTRAQGRAWETAARHEAELRASAEALRESEAQALAANRAKDEFLATLSHELRTPLNVVLGWASMLRLPNVREDRLPHALDIIERNARQQAELIDDLLDVSRIVTGKLRVEPRLVAFGPVVLAVVEALKPSAESKGVALIVASMVEGVTIKGDSDRLHQIVRNLLSNAIKFTPAGGRVSIELTREHQRAKLTIRDSGVGIAPEFLPHVFERFRQADSSTTRTHSGVGLGLSIVRHLVELHGGTVQARSEGKGHGSTFIVNLPAVTVLTTAPGPAPFAPATRQLAPRLEGVRVLVVDDEPNTRELLAEALNHMGARVTATDSARAALDRLTIEGTDVIVSDIAMPGEDGFWLMQRIRELPGRLGRTPAIALTALARNEDRKRAMAVGYQMHLPKPVQLDELQSRVASLVGRGSDRTAHQASA